MRHDDQDGCDPDAVVLQLPAESEEEAHAAGEDRQCCSQATRFLVKRRGWRRGERQGERQGCSHLASLGGYRPWGEDGGSVGSIEAAYREGDGLIEADTRGQWCDVDGPGRV